MNTQGFSEIQMEVVYLNFKVSQYFKICTGWLISYSARCLSNLLHLNVVKYWPFCTKRLVIIYFIITLE